MGRRKKEENVEREEIDNDGYNLNEIGFTENVNYEKELEYSLETFDELSKLLKMNTSVVEKLFDKLNLRIDNFSFRALNDENADCDLLIELSSIKGDTISSSVDIKVNLYDIDGELIYTDKVTILSREFGGFDTVKIQLRDNGRLLLIADSAKIFATRY